MANREVVEYISSGISKGYSSQKLRAHLINSGFPDELVDEAIIEANSKNYSKGKTKTMGGNLDKKSMEVKKFSWKWIILGLVVIIISVAIMGLIKLFYF